MKDIIPFPCRKTQHTMNSWTISKAQTKDHLERSGENQCMVGEYSATKDRSWYYTDLHSSQNTMTEWKRTPAMFSAGSGWFPYIYWEDQDTWNAAYNWIYAALKWTHI